MANDLIQAVKVTKPRLAYVRVYGVGCVLIGEENAPGGRRGGILLAGLGQELGHR